MTQLRVLAVSAPYWPVRAAAQTRILGSRVPFSLQNACRLAAGAALSGQGVWGQSNWKDRDTLRESVVMYDYADDLYDFEKKLREIQPNLLLIAAMTLALPGAVLIAKMAREILGDGVAIVLGGKHPSETIYRAGAQVQHHPGSPLRLVSEGKIPASLFDVVVSGDGEHIIARLGELVADSRNVKDNLDKLWGCPGNWIAGTVSDGTVKTVISSGARIDYTSMPIPAEIFGFEGAFKVFGTDRTAHVYSDSSRGCIMDCFFCTERRLVNGVPQVSGSAHRLARQFTAVLAEGARREDRVSAFVEDSILLMGSPNELTQLHHLMGTTVLPFGGQITIDLLLHQQTQDALRLLTQNGLCYLYAGLETGSEEVARRMSKNTGGRKGGWMTRNESAIRTATGMGLRYGVAICFGLGESQADRINLLTHIVEWQQRYDGNPCVVSLNWGTQHPLLNAGQFDYVQWGTAAGSERLPLFQEMFGEASELYPVTPGLPTVEELAEIKQFLDGMMLLQ